MTYRIIIQKIEKGKFTHIKQFTINTLGDVINKLSEFPEYLEWCESKYQELLERNKKLKIQEIKNSDHFDIESYKTFDKSIEESIEDIIETIY